MLRKPSASACSVCSTARAYISSDDCADGDCISRNVPKLIISLSTRPCEETVVPGEKWLAASRRDQEDFFEPTAVPLVAWYLQMRRDDHAIFDGPVLVAVAQLHVDMLQAEAVEEDESVVGARHTRLAHRL